MIDTDLIASSKPISPVIDSIEKSWRRCFKQYSQRPRLPFVEPNMEVTIDGQLEFIIKGYCGRHTTLFVYGDRQTFCLKEPIVKDNFSLFGVYGSQGKLKYLFTKEAHGTHYMGMNNRGYYELCLGDIKFRHFALNTYSGFRNLCSEVMESRKTINLNSLGDVYLADYPQLNCVLKENLSTRDKIQVMLAYELIEKML